MPRHWILFSTAVICSSWLFRVFGTAWIGEVDGGKVGRRLRLVDSSLVLHFQSMYSRSEQQTYSAAWLGFVGLYGADCRVDEIGATPCRVSEALRFDAVSILGWIRNLIIS